jgi:hypothetical protein
VNTKISEFPKHPLPHVPQPQPQPTVFVYEKETWEYKVVVRSTADDPPLGQDELNALGSDGWELVGIVTLPSVTQFYLKRPRG